MTATVAPGSIGSRQAQSGSPGRPWRGVLALGTFAIGTDGFVIAGVLPGIARDMHVTLGAAGLLVSIFALVYGLSAPLLTAALSRLERRRVLVAGMAVLAAANLAAALASGYAWLAAARVAAALGAAAFSPVALAAAVQLSPDSVRGRAVSSVLAGMTASLVASVPLGALLGSLGSWRWTFGLVAAISAIAALGIGVCLPRIAPVRTSSLRARLVLLARPPVLANLIAAFIWITGAFAVYTFVAPVLRAATGWNGVGISGLLLVYGVAAFVGNTVGGHTADRWGAKRSIVLALASLVVILSALGWAADEGPPIGLPVSIAALAAWATAGWSLTPSLAHRLVALTPAVGPEVLSLNTSAIYLGIAAGAAVGGPVLAHLGVAQLGFTAAGLQLLALALVIGAPTRSSGHRKAETEIQTEPALVPAR